MFEIIESIISLIKTHIIDSIMRSSFMSTILLFVASSIFIITMMSMLCSCTVKQEYDFQLYDHIAIKPYDRYTYITAEDLFFSLNDDIYIINTGFKSDLASIPRVLWWLYSPRYSGFIYPAIVHDWMYRENIYFSKEQADNIFYYALINQDVSRFTASLFWLSVKWFGKCSYKE